MKRIAFILISFLFANFLYAQQEYKIEYDYLTNEVKYFKKIYPKKKKKKEKDVEKSKQTIVDSITYKEVSPRRLRKNNRIEFKITNVNPLALETKLSKEEKNLNVGPGFSVPDLFGKFSKLSNVNFSNINSSAISIADTINSARGIASSAFDSVKPLISDIEDATETSYDISFSTQRTKMQILNGLINLMDQLDVKKYSNNKLQYAELKDVEFYLIDDTDEVDNFNKNIKMVISAFQEEYNFLSNLEFSLSEAEELSEENLASRLIIEEEFVENKTNILNTYYKTIDNLKLIETLYNYVKESEFNSVKDLSLESDETILILKFDETGFRDPNAEKRTMRQRELSFMAFGDWKINTGVALTFNTFGKNFKDYYIDEEGKIGADENDFFVPNISTMINFYPFLGKNLNIGGSFGLSIPISDSNLGVNYLLGLSTFIGNKNRVSFSGGAVYGPVMNLSEGRSVGDVTTETNTNNLIRKEYDLGMFFGVSFSLFDIVN